MLKPISIGTGFTKEWVRGDFEQVEIARGVPNFTNTLFF
jgi:hypothetical protein